MKLHIAAVGRMKKGPEKELFDSYCRRLPWPLELIEVDDRKTSGLPDGPEREGKALLDSVPAGAWVVMLDETGKQLTSRALAQSLEGWRDQGYSPIAFLVGGADGHGQIVRNEANMALSLGEMTWPHMLARVMLAEQLYRAWSISSKHPYHRD